MKWTQSVEMDSGWLGMGPLAAAFGSWLSALAHGDVARRPTLRPAPYYVRTESTKWVLSED